MVIVVWFRNIRWFLSTAFDLCIFAQLHTCTRVHNVMVCSQDDANEA